MYVKKQDLELCLRKADEINDHYKLVHIGSDDPQKYVDYLLHSCMADMGIKSIKIVRTGEIQHVDSAVYSMCVMHSDGSFDIVVAAGLNHCWFRYTVCKEIFHALLDSEDYRNMDLAQHIEDVTVGFDVDESRPDRSAAAEFVAEIAAMEFMFPYARRQQEKQAEQPNYPAIAQKYRIPQVLVDKYMSDRFMQTLESFSRRLQP